MKLDRSQSRGARRPSRFRPVRQRALPTEPAIRTRRFLFLALLALLAAVPAYAQGVADRFPAARDFFPGADRFGELEGTPPAAPVYREDRLLGYVFLTADMVRIPAYSGKPINTLIGVDVAGRIAGLTIVEHEEPILLVGISEERLQRFAAQYRGVSAYDRTSVGATREGQVTIDAISGATITVMVENATIMRSLRLVAESRGLPLPGADTAAAPPTTAADGAREAPAAEAAPASRPAATARSPAAGPAATAPGGAAPVMPTDDEPIWVGVWRERAFQIALLVTGLTLLTLILVFQDWLARHPKLLIYVRDGYLVFTILFIGWYALAQLSVVNVLTFTHAVFHDFRWESFLIDPMMFILWGFVAVTLLLWGRGVYCGWLCPYGAIQELTQQLAQRFKVRQFEFPDVVHERLWALKYVILIVLFGVSLQSLADAERLAEVEPFKTAITMRFMREWGFVLYAVGFIAVSAVNRKFFCKYVCPLGAALAIPARFRIFDWWLRRRKECGRPCQICANECEVRAIRPTGEINANECHYCLDCQVTYYNAYKCPPEVDRRKRRERVPRAREIVRELEMHIGPAGLDDRSRASGDRGCEGCPQRDGCE
ncbi:ferredoxin [Sulfurifustis variabilis]|uniref:Ferredoxin n=1 Tax=Sulfurifustis variabilis TaxID=1675686 RepID=A0A1B4VAG3_9GAMM|nr:NosR/NirI family protein [Sulfurifustis variabilis]BAU46931.1 ferredoxin [Sulfurifustis variabilis]